MSETKVIRCDRDLLTALRQVVAALRKPGVDLRWDEGRAGRLGLVLTVDGQEHAFDVVARPSVAGRDIDRMDGAAGNTILATVQLSETLVKHCVRRGLSAIGLNGRAWIRKPGLVIDTCTPDLPIRYRLPEPKVQPFSPRSCRLGRALLSSEVRKWTLPQLAAAAQLSLSRVSEVLGVFADEGWVTGRRGDWQLAKPDELLDAWAAADRWGERGSMKEYTSLEPTPAAVAARLLAIRPEGVAFTQWYAANLRHPYTTTPICSAYLHGHLSEEEAAAAGLREVATGGKLWAIVPRDDGVFHFVRKAGDHPVVCDAQIYLDLLQVGLRGPDQARALRAWEGFRR